MTAQKPQQDPSAGFKARFAASPDHSAEAHGRVNLIGEHTDYSGGFVLPTLIPQRTRVWLRKRDDDLVQVASAQMGGMTERYRLGEEVRTHGWLDYVGGVTWAAQRAGHDISGVDLFIDSTVPVGAGLSSSAAIEVAVLRALRNAFGWSLDDRALALLARRAENEHVGAPVGIMDQLVCSLGKLGEALFIDTRALTTRPIRLPAEAEVIVINSGVRHELASNEYRTRRQEVERAAVALGVAELRDLDPTRVAELDKLPEPLGRRARHVLTENQRVLEAVKALIGRDLRRLGELLWGSHASLRDDFQVSVPEIDLLIELAHKDPRVLGARMTGGGFGGSVVGLCEAGKGAAAAHELAARYAASSPYTPEVLLPIGED